MHCLTKATKQVQAATVTFATTPTDSSATVQAKMYNRTTIWRWRDSLSDSALTTYDVHRPYVRQPYARLATVWTVGNRMLIAEWPTATTTMLGANHQNTIEARYPRKF